MNEGKQDLEVARLQQMLERSCWKTHNEKNKLDMVLWIHLELWGDNLPLMENEFDWYEQIGEKVYRTGKDKWRTWIIYKHHNSNKP